jgi:hypothetical protein
MRSEHAALGQAAAQALAQAQWPREMVWVRGDLQVLYASQACYHQASFNQAHAYRELELRVTVGSLGIGLAHEEPFYEFGGADFTTFAHYKQYTVESDLEPGCHLWDAHIWLEDADGRVYDVVSGVMKNCAEVRGKTLRFLERHVIEGLDKSQLAAAGLHYIAAPGAAQAVLMTAISRQWRPAFDTSVAVIEAYGAYMRALSACE